MWSVRKLIQAGVFCSAVLGCGSESITGNQIPDVAGNWHASRAQVTSVANSANTIELIAFGATIQVVFSANHTFVTTATFPGEAPDVSTGTYTVTATKLTLTNDQASGGDIQVFDVALNNGTLLLTNGTINFDFGAGDVASKLSITLVH